MSEQILSVSSDQFATALNPPVSQLGLFVATLQFSASHSEYFCPFSIFPISLSEQFLTFEKRVHYTRRWFVTAFITRLTLSHRVWNNTHLSSVVRSLGFKLGFLFVSSALAKWFRILSWGELSYLAPLGSENISAPYFNQCFFGEGEGYYPPDSQTPRLPVPRQK